MLRSRAYRRRWLCLLGVVGVALTLAVSGGTASAAEPVPGPAAWLFDPNTVVGIDLGLPPASIEALENEPEEEYQPATFSLTAGGQTYGPLDIGVRLKGGVGSFRSLPDEKAAFKVKLDAFVDDQTFFGLEKLTLNNMVQDPSMIHETLAYEAFRSVGVAAPRSGYAFVQVNGEPFGLYLNVETLDSVALPRWFDSTAHLYEGSYGADVKPGAPAFEVDEGSKKNLGDLAALTTAANSMVGDWSDGMAGFADLDQMARMWAVERYIGHWDGYSGVPGENLRPNNFYLHSDEAGEFQMLPWGTDQTWDARLEFDEEGAGLLFERCLADTSCAATYRDALQQVGSAIAGLDLDSHIDYLAKRLAPCEALEVESRREYSAAEIEAGIDGVRDFVAVRPAELADWLGQPLGDSPAEAPLEPPDEEVCVPPAPAQPDPEPELAEPALEASGPPDSTSLASGDLILRVGAARLAGAAVATPVDLPESGRVAQHVFVRVHHGWTGVCLDREVRYASGSLTMRCKLSSAALRQLARHSLALRIRIDFMPFDGESRFVLRHLTLPKG